MTDEPRPRLPLPSEDTGDLTDTPASGDTDDYLVAREEGVPYRPPTERVVGEVRMEQGGPDQAGVGRTDDHELARRATVAERPTDDALLDRCLQVLRASELPAGNRIRLAARDRAISVHGQVESIDVLDEILSLLGDVPGVEHVIDETTVSGV